MSLKVYCRIPSTWGATMFYRFLQPLSFMQKAGLVEPYVDYGTLELPQQLRVNAMAYSDIHWAYMDQSVHFQNLLEATAKDGAYWRTPTHWEPPVNMVMDTDDDIFNVSPLNYRPFQMHGTRYNGVELERGFKITAPDTSGNTVTIFEDGKNINLQLNQARIAQLRHNFNIASLVTVSTPACAAYVAREAPGAQTYINPNCVDLSDYPKIELAGHEPTVRLLWQGGDSHLHDMFLIRDALARVLRDYPNVELVIWGAKYIWPEWPAAQVRYEPWCDYREYKLRLNQMNHDINLAPLVKDIFNEAKSSIKVYESAACWKPAPSLASRVGPYTEFEDQTTAMLFSDEGEFEGKLRELIEDSVLRRRIAGNCKDWVASERDPLTWAHKLAEQFQALRTGRRAVTNPPPVPVPEESNADPVPAIVH